MVFGHYRPSSDFICHFCYNNLFLFLCAKKNEENDDVENYYFKKTQLSTTKNKSLRKIAQNKKNKTDLKKEKIVFIE